MDKETYLVLETFLNLTQDMKKRIKKDKGEERFDMCEALLEYYQDGVNEGIEKGFIQAVVETARECNKTKDYAIEKIMKKFNMDRVSAVTNVELYWI